MLSVRDLRVTFGALAAVDGVSLTVPDGSVVVLLGPSGCGKSTLLRAIAGLEPSARGDIAWDGVDLARVPVHRRGFGLMFQDGVLFPHRTVAGNVGYGISRQHDAEQRVDELLDLVGLGGYQRRRVDTLSGGEAQRVALARALAPRPRLLLLDEPLAALDRALRESLLADLRTILTTTRSTALFVTHDHAEAFAVADTVAVMRHGRIVQSGPPRAVWDTPVDDWTAEFLGCSTVLDAEPHRDAGGGWTTHTPLGSLPGSADRVGLRPRALLVDRAGSIAAEVLALVPGVDEQRLTVRLTDASLADDSPGMTEVSAVAPSGMPIEIGHRVRLRWDPAEAVLIGAR